MADGALTFEDTASQGLLGIQPQLLVTAASFPSTRGKKKNCNECQQRKQASQAATSRKKNWIIKVTREACAQTRLDGRGQPEANAHQK
jgi:hypothetical protein